MVRHAVSRRSTLAAAVLSLLLADGAQAHHGFSMYDIGREVTLAGTVRDFQWSNPHTWIRIMAKDANGNNLEWSIEGANPYVLARFGWTRRSLKAGDKIEAVIHPLRTGEARGSLIRVTANGRLVGAADSN